ncbi:hypothetical protein RHMOL_Rhmol09G0164300 [Rhododendron molle]|uniref:Uncharacterized protein n=1 Tax=Rhododendron molle TaxID=49168 RepID=A0ACC0MFF6_RHOML|nr:hypothetical protein RHMOL_Rhmol09G0164300 [Rhododendron molle]
MARPSWLVDSNRFATKIKSASGSCDPESVNWKSNPTRACPNCQYVIDNSDVKFLSFRLHNLHVGDDGEI